MNDGSVQWQKVEQRLGKGRMGARKRKMNEGKGERERCDEGRGSWRGSKKEKGKRQREEDYTIFYYVGRSERKGARWEDKDGVDAGYRSVGLKTTLRGRGAVCKTDHVRVGGARGARGPRGSLRSL